MSVRGSVLAQREGTGPFGSAIETVDLDKSWEGLHFLLSGSKEPSSHPEGFLVGHSSLPNTGEAEVFHYRVAQVRAINEALQRCTPEVLQQRYDGRLMREFNVYPACEWGVADCEYLLEYYERLRQFVARHAAEQNELLVVIC